MSVQETNPQNPPPAASSSPPPPPPMPPSTLDYIYAWGESPFPPTLLATLIAPLHMRPFRPLPMLFPPVLLFTTYLNLLDPKYKRDAAGLSATWAGLYLVLAAARKQKLKNKFTVRGAVRGAAMGVGCANLVAGGSVYMFGLRNKQARSGDGDGDRV
ncbi:hypothetical protein AAP_02896 [Ascosphaera apis ARSEF 7405]|uniref:Uncharacterized protein n=1 Tax=Ascosphaera apis ARSEF 7405 TaxID=392613 RepID=A0A167Z6M4_9EURO|nr:hypothetical protein AAP_02896 [Ascosphaera apis ARSEF 7405]